MTLMRTRWQVAEPPPKSHLESLQGLDPLLVQVLYQRGCADRAAIEAFLHHQPAGSTDPFLLLGMEAAVDRVAHAIRRGETIAVYGDYDADGVTGTVLLTDGLRAMGAARVIPYIPHRVEEGYGLSKTGLERLAEQGVSLVITVDCGSRGVREIEHAGKLGLEVIVTDHHSTGLQLPPALALINPKQPGDTYPNPTLAGVGITFKLVQGLVARGFRPEGLAVGDLLDLVALGTVADLAPLVGENRSLVHQGLQVINQGRRPGLAALMRRAGIRPGQVTATTIGYGLGPRINAAGRVAHASYAAKLLITQDPTAADRLALTLNKLNRERQDMTRQMAAFAQQLAYQEAPDVPLLFAAHADFSPGIAGLIASRLTEETYRPAVVAHIRGDKAVGSCRSIPEFHITEALDQCDDLLIKHGGHAAAAGFTVGVDKLPDLKQRLLTLAGERLGGRELIPTLSVDLELELGDIIWEVYEAVSRLEPCGYANPAPLFVSYDVQVHSARAVGADGGHLKLILADGDCLLDAIAFRMGHLVSQLGPTVDVAYYVETNEWNGQTSLQLNVQDMRPAGRE